MSEYKSRLLAKCWEVTATMKPVSPIITDFGHDEADAQNINNEITPVEYFLASIASCLAISYRMVMEAKKMSVIGVDVTVSACKEKNLPSRICDINASVSFNNILDNAIAEQLTKDAKRICTISNTLNAVPNLKITIV
jgi:uncharacterized OsmC-like protein